MNKQRPFKLPIIIFTVALLAILHWSRNQWNPNVNSLADVADWTELTPQESIFHRIGLGNENNRKFVSPNGRGEAIFRPDPAGGEPTLVTEPINVGTYNFFGPRLLAGIPHAVFDVLPYFILGNTPSDMFNLGRFRVLFR